MFSDGEDVTPKVNEQNDVELDLASRAAVKSFKKRRPNFDLDRMNVPRGATLTSVETGEEITVTGPKTVRCRNEEMSLTRATKEVLEMDERVAPTRHWLFEGRKLREIYLEIYGDQEEPVSFEEGLPPEAAGAS